MCGWAILAGSHTAMAADPPLDEEAIVSLIELEIDEKEENPITIFGDFYKNVLSTN